MKGQYFSFDAIIAAVIFVLALVALLSYWHSVKSFLDYQSESLSKDAIRISNLLFTPPTPAGVCGNMDRLGLALDWDDKRVDASVLACAKEQDQDWLRERLGTPNDVYIRITNLASSDYISIGDDVPEDASNVAKITRLATVVNTTDGSNYLARIELSVYN